jgi:acetyl/propionyl-CoA carboxylase alpha subunit
VDTGLGPDDRLPPDYDNLMGKVLVHAEDRDGAIDRLRRALDETAIAGLQSTLPFHRFVARHAGFRAGELSTDWVAEHWDGAAERARFIDAAVAAAAARAAIDAATGNAALADGRTPPAPSPNGRWGSAALADATDRWPR